LEGSEQFERVVAISDPECGSAPRRRLLPHGLPQALYSLADGTGSEAPQERADWGSLKRPLDVISYQYHYH